MRVAFLYDVLDGRLSHAAKRAKAEAESVPLNGENIFGFIDIGRKNLDILFLHVCNILGNFLDFVDTVVQDTSKKFFGIKIFEIRRPISDDGM